MGRTHSRSTRANRRSPQLSSSVSSPPLTLSPPSANWQGGWLDGDGMLHCVVLPVEVSDARLTFRELSQNKSETARETLRRPTP